MVELRGKVEGHDLVITGDNIIDNDANDKIEGCGTDYINDGNHRNVVDTQGVIGSNIRDK